MKINLTRAEIETDGMPKQVASALLTDPKAKLSNAFRKRCKRARETVYSSATPLRTNRREDKTDHSLYSTPPNSTSTYNKLAAAGRAQLFKWLKRSVARRNVAQGKYVTLQALPESKLRDQALTILALQVSALDAQYDTICNEIDRRNRQSVATRASIVAAARVPPFPRHNPEAIRAAHRV
jgi:hypothetical protein